MTPDEARDALAEAASPFQGRFEKLYREILDDLATLHGEGLTWELIQSKHILDGMERMQGRAYSRAVEGMWLDLALQRGFSFPIVDIPEMTPDDGEDG